MSIKAWIAEPIRALERGALRLMAALSKRPARPERGGEELPPKLPRHVAIIMDGNGRWAKKRSLPRAAGHSAGVEALRGIIRACDDWHIKALSIYVFSTENWSRPQDEVGALMGLLLRSIAAEIDELHEKNACIRVLGDLDGLPGPQRDALNGAADRTRHNGRP